MGADIELLENIRDELIEQNKKMDERNQILKEQKEILKETNKVLGEEIRRLTDMLYNNF